MTLYKVARFLSKGQEVRDQAPYWGKKVNDGMQRIGEQSKPIRGLGRGKELVRIFDKSHLIMCTAREHTILVVNRILNIKGLFLHCNQ